MCDTLGIDVWEVVDAARTKPFGFMPFYPGPGLGGHCIPIDPFYLSWKARQFGFEPRFIELAGHVNGAMPHYVVDKIAEALNTRRKAINGSTVLVAGITYKRDIDDMRESPSLDVMHLLEERGATVLYSDPWVPVLPASAWSGGHELHSVALTDETIASADCVAILTDHRVFDYETLVNTADLLVDTRNATRSQAPHVFRLGAPNRTATTAERSRAGALA
jgi:UDP-N-acetyl-D-glucosamine dehydrogenase